MSRRFPIDCPLDCEFHKMWDLSVDDYTHVCKKLGKQMDECDYGYGMFLLCPMESEAESEEERQESKEELQWFDIA